MKIKPKSTLHGKNQVVLLPLKSAPAIKPSKKDDDVIGKLYYVVRDYAKARDLELIAKPKADVSKSGMPEDPTALSPKELGQYYAVNVAWYGYARAQLAKVKIEVIEMETALRRLKAKLVLSMIVDKAKKYEVDSQVIMDEEYQEQENHTVMAKAREMALEAVVDRHERQIAGLSRELSRRGFESDAIHRQENVQ